MFFFDLELNRWKLDAIVGISQPIADPDRGGNDLRRVTLNNGQTVLVHESNLDNIDKGVCKVFPAKSGLLAITFEDEEGIQVKPILAWALTLGGSVLPITRDGINDGGGGTLPVIDPDVSENVDGFYRSIPHYHSSQTTIGGEVP